MTEKMIQRHSLDLANDQQVRAEDFVTLSLHKCMTHDKMIDREIWARAEKLIDVDISWPTALRGQEDTRSQTDRICT